MKNKTYNVSDQFLIAFLKTFSDRELQTSLTYDRYMFPEHSDGRIKATVVLSGMEEDTKEGFENIQKVYSLIATTLFDVHDSSIGFPKAQKFIDIFMPEEDYDITIAKIASVYIRRAYYENCKQQPKDIDN